MGASDGLPPSVVQPASSTNDAKAIDTVRIFVMGGL
jgi:hypothetical protein